MEGGVTSTTEPAVAVATAMPSADLEKQVLATVPTGGDAEKKAGSGDAEGNKKKEEDKKEKTAQVCASNCS